VINRQDADVHGVPINLGRSALYLYVYVIYDLILCLDCTELENGARLTAQGEPWGCFHKTYGGGQVSNISRLEAGNWVDGSHVTQVRLP
jgi:hypothetical protein